MKTRTPNTFTGLPPVNSGLKVVSNAACFAAALSNRCPVTGVAWVTIPFSSTTICTLTSPRTLALTAAGGVTGIGRVKAFSFNTPPEIMSSQWVVDVFAFAGAAALTICRFVLSSVKFSFDPVSSLSPEVEQPDNISKRIVPEQAFSYFSNSDQGHHSINNCERTQTETKAEAQPPYRSDDRCRKGKPFRTGHAASRQENNCQIARNNTKKDLLSLKIVDKASRYRGRAGLNFACRAAATAAAFRSG